MHAHSSLQSANWVLSPLIQQILYFFLFQTQWSISCNHLIVTKQSLYGRNVNCEISSDEKLSAQASRSVAQNFKLLSELTETFVASWCATTVDRSIQCSAVFDLMICWKAFLTGEFISSWETSRGSGGTSQSLRATHPSADGKTTHTYLTMQNSHWAAPWSLTMILDGTQI